MTRLGVKRSAARGLCRWLGVPMLRKANPRHDAQGRFATKGEGVQKLADYIGQILNGTKEERARLAMSYFEMAKTPQELKAVGLTGNSFTVRYGVISRHKNKNEAHSLSADEWRALCKKLENADNLVVAKHGEGLSVFVALPDTTMVGVTVKNAGKNLAVNSVSTVYKREIKEGEEIVYPTGKKVSPEQSALLNRQKLSISASSDTDSNIPQPPKNASEKHGVKTIAQRKEEAAQNGAQELINDFSNRTKLTLDEVKTLFDYENEDAGTALLFDKVYDLVKNEHFDINLCNLGSWVYGRSYVITGGIEYNRNLYKMPHKNGHKASQTLLHELVHHITNRAVYVYNGGKYCNYKLSEEEREACQTLKNVLRQIRKDADFDNEYGRTDIYEMVAELANPRFREKLKRKNLWIKIVDAIAKIVGVFKKGYKATTAFETMEGALYKLLDDYKPYSELVKVNRFKQNAFKYENVVKHTDKGLAFDVTDIPDAEFENPTKDFELKPLNDRFFEATKTPKKPLLLKQNILLKNKTHHPEINTPELSKKILSQALYGNNVVMLCKPKDKPNYWSVVKEGGEYYVSVIDTDPAKKYNEVVGWRKIDKKRYVAMKRRAREEDGQFLITEGIKDSSSRAADLSALHSGEGSIPRAAQKSSAIPRFTLRKSAARQIMRYLRG